MPQLIAAQCPTCGANLHIDPAAEFALCQYCSTSSFVRTKARPISRQRMLEDSPVIDLAGPRYGWLIAVVALVTMSSVAIVAAFIKYHGLQTHPSLATAPAPTTDAAPDAIAATPSASTPSREDSAPKAAVPDSSLPAPQSNGPGGGRRGRVATGQITVSGRLEPGAIRAVVGGNTARFRMCYEQGLARTSTLAGRVAVRFVIGRDGTVSNLSDAGSDLADTAAKSCVLSAFYGLNFPLPERGIVTVTYPLIFRPER